MKKIFIPVFICVVLLAATLNGAAAESTSGAAYKGASAWALPELDRALEYGLITDRIRNNMRLSITREEFAEVMVNLYELCTGEKASVGSAGFTDTSNPEVLKAANLGYIQGMGEEKFGPGLLITRAQMATVLHRALTAFGLEDDYFTSNELEFTDDNLINNWAKEGVYYCSKVGIIKGIQEKEEGGYRFDPAGNSSREAAVVVCTRAYELFFDGYTGMNQDWNTEETEDESSNNWNEDIYEDGWFEDEQADSGEADYGSQAITILPSAASATGFVGQTEKGPMKPQLITSIGEYTKIYGGGPQGLYLMPYSVKGFFENGGAELYIARVTPQSKTLLNDGINRYDKVTLPVPLLSDYLGIKGNDVETATGLYALGLIDEITMLYSPDACNVPGLNQAMINQCESLGDRIVIMDSLPAISNPAPLEEYESIFAAYYSPWLKVTDAGGREKLVPPGGFIAGTYIANDLTKGMHKVPAGIRINGITGPEREIGAAEQSRMTLNRVNPIIKRADGSIIANSARTLSNDQEYAYINFRRYANFIKESIAESLEPVSHMYWDNSLQNEIRRAVENFLLTEWNKGALLGNQPRLAYYVSVYQDKANSGVNVSPRKYIEIGLALVKPAEFIVLVIDIG